LLPDSYIVPGQAVLRESGGRRNLLRYCVLLNMKKLYAFVFYFLLCGSLLGQDLFITGVTGTKEFHYYDELTNTATVVNSGIVKASYMEVGVYLSVDGVKDASDKLLGKIYTSGVGAASTLNASLSEIMVKAAAGSYYLIVVADVDNDIAETDETNNTYVVPGYTVLAADLDLVVSAFSLDKSIYTGNDRVVASYTVQNLQSSNLGGGVQTSFYLSTDNALSSDDTYLNNGYVSFVGPDNVSDSEYLSLPAATPGEYYIIANVDDRQGTHYLTEVNESNNTFVRPITITKSNIDLEIPIIDYAYSMSGSGNYLNITASFQLRNNGTTPATGFYVTAYLSPTTYLQPGAISAGYMSFDGYWGYIKGGEQQGQSINFTPFAGSYYGDQYLILVVNSGGPYDTPAPIEESNYNNNTTVYWEPITIEWPVQSFSILSAGLNGTVDATDRRLSVDVTLYNQGTIPNIQAEHHVTIVNASQDVVFETYQRDYPYIYPGTSTTIDWTIDLDNPLPVGDYTLEIDCSSNTYNCGGSYSIPFKVVQPPYTLDGSIIGEDKVALTKGKLFLYQKGPDGEIKFINKIDPVQTEQFAFSVDEQPYTLYFIPDRTALPDYVPTILGKTIALNDKSFVSLSANTYVKLEVIKLASWPLGNRVIRGSIVAGGSGSRIDMGRTQATDVANIPVVLLSDAGVPIRLAYTDNEGNYVFDKLPGGNYQLFASMAPDSPVSMKEPVSVDATKSSITVQLGLSQSGAADAAVEPFFRPQAISFAAFEKIYLGDAPVSINATTDSGLPLTFTSTNTAVASIENGKVIINGIGTADITASQAGDGDFEAATSVTRTLVVENVMGIEPAGNSIRLFPNPTTGLLTIEGATQADAFFVTDALGKQITTLSSTGNSLDLRAVPSGIYFLSLQHASGVKVFRIVKE